MNVTHGITMNGRIHGELKNPDFPPREELRRLVNLVDGEHRYSLILWTLPDAVQFDRIDHRRWPTEYLQVAGSRDRLTVEMRKIVNGRAGQFVIGRAPHDEATLEVIRWNSTKTLVSSNEIFDSLEAGNLLAAYYELDDVPRNYHRRMLDM